MDSSFFNIKLDYVLLHCSSHDRCREKATGERKDRYYPLSTLFCRMEPNVMMVIKAQGKKI